jgi:hypothetical protein
MPVDLDSERKAGSVYHFSSPHFQSADIGGECNGYIAYSRGWCMVRWCGVSGEENTGTNTVTQYTVA